MRNGIVERTTTGAQFGLKMGAGFSLLATVMIFVAGPSAFRARYHMSPLTLIGWYFASGAIAGAIAGALSPFCRSRVGAATVGFIAGMPVFSLGFFLYPPAHQLSLADQAKLVLLLSILVGPAMGIIAKKRLA